MIHYPPQQQKIDLEIISCNICMASNTTEKLRRLDTISQTIDLTGSNVEHTTEQQTEQQTEQDTNIETDIATNMVSDNANRIAPCPSIFVPAGMNENIRVPQRVPQRVPPRVAMEAEQQARNDQFTTFMLQKLDEIKTYGRVMPHYKLSAPRRCWNVTSTTLCCGTCCAPCLAWDFACCCLSAVCSKNPFRWGLSFQTIAKTCDDTFADERENALCKYKFKEVSYAIVGDVGEAYIQEFDRQIQTQTVQGAKKANMIRAELASIIRRFGPAKYCVFQDDGNIETLKMIIHTEFHALQKI